MQKIKEFKKLLNIKCTDLMEQGGTIRYFINVKLESANPHNILKYDLTKDKSNFEELYKKLTEEIFDFDNIFTHLKGSNSKQQKIEQVNSSLKQCLSRLDILLHSSFIHFIQIHHHYQDFLNCNTEKAKMEGNFIPHPNQLKSSNFQQITQLISFKESHKLNTPDSRVRQVIFVDHQGDQFYILLYLQGKSKIGNFFKSFFGNQQQGGKVSIYKRVNGKIQQKVSQVLQTQPLSMQFSIKTSMLTILSSIGVSIYLFKSQPPQQQLVLFDFLKAPSIRLFAYNANLAEIYFIRDSVIEIFSLNKQISIKSNCKIQKDSSILFDDDRNYLFVSTENNLRMYSTGNLQLIQEVKLKCSNSFEKLSINQGYLFGLTNAGFMTIFDLQSNTKQAAISLITNIDIPTTKNPQITICSKNKKLIISYFNQSLILIDTLQGPLFSLKGFQHSQIIDFQYNKRSNEISIVNEEGDLNIYQLHQILI